MYIFLLLFSSIDFILTNRNYFTYVHFSFENSINVMPVTAAYLHLNIMLCDHYNIIMNLIFQFIT